jgi:transketolase
MTSGLSITLLSLVGSLENIHGLNHFGHSAPYKVLDKEFGYNGETVYNEVKRLLAK